MDRILGFRGIPFTRLFARSHWSVLAPRCQVFLDTERSRTYIATFTISSTRTASQRRKKQSDHPNIHNLDHGCSCKQRFIQEATSCNIQLYPALNHSLPRSQSLLAGLALCRLRRRITRRTQFQAIQFIVRMSFPHLRDRIHENMLGLIDLGCFPARFQKQPLHDLNFYKSI